MRYWVRMGTTNKGPLTPELLATLPRFSRYSLVCPENLSPKRRENWRLAHSFPELRGLLP
jgi:hypothetical protein